MPFTEAPKKPERATFEHWQPPERVVLTSKGFRIPLDCPANVALARTVQPLLRHEYPENPHASRWSKKKDPLLSYKREFDPESGVEHLLIPKAWGILQFSGREGFSFTNCQLPGLRIREELKFSEKRSLLETERRPQQTLVSYALKHLTRTGGACLCVPVGTGKTVMGLNIIVTLPDRPKTLIVAAKGDLLDQWEDRANEYIPGCRVGRIQADVCITENCDIVLATAQTLSQKLFDPDMLREFGMVIFDEAHHAAAPSFLHAVWQVAAPYMLALTADPTRSDGMTDILFQFFSWNVYVIAPVLPPDIFLNIRAHRLARRCYVEDSDMVDAKERRERNLRYPDADDAETRVERPQTALAAVDVFSEKKYTAVYKGVARQANRNALIVAYIKHFLTHNDVRTVHAPTEEEVASTEMPAEFRGAERSNVQVSVDGEKKPVNECSSDESKRMQQVERQIMVLTVHKEHILSLRARLIRSGVPEHMIAIYWGDLKKAARVEALNKRVLLCTYGMAAEGLDLPTLNTIILATPRSKTADQATGRMLRDRLTAEIQPCLIDMVDTWCQMADAMYWKRHATFKMYAPQVDIRFYDDDRTDTILGAYCKKRPAIINDPTKQKRKACSSKNKKTTDKRSKKQNE